MTNTALGLVSEWLRCPHCHQQLATTRSGLACPNNHSFNRAKQGYVNLMPKAPGHNSDTPAMVAARERFLAAGWFAPIADAVASAADGATRLLEVGAGTGYYLAHALAAPDALGLATDVSPAAAKRAAKAHPRMASIVADTWAGLPIADNSVDGILCVFAPRNPTEFQRVLTPGGCVVVVTPTTRHLTELRAANELLTIDDNKAATVAEAFSAFAPDLERIVEFSASFDAASAGDLIAMGPNAFHNKHLSATVDTTVSVTVQRFTA